MRGKLLLTLALCVALLCGAMAAAEEELLSAPVEADVEEVETELWGDAAMEPVDAGDEGAVLALPVEQVPAQAGQDRLWGTGLTLEDDAPEADGERAVAAIDATEGSLGGDVRWTLSEDGTLTVFGTGEATFSPWCYWEGSSIQRVVVCEGVTALPESCFYKEMALLEASLPASLTGISPCLFSDCEKLESVTMAGGEVLGCFAFSRCLSLKTVKLPPSLKTIGASAFGDCGALTSVTLPEGLETIEMSAFQGTALESLTTPASLRTIGMFAFNEVPLRHVQFADGLQTIDSNAFRGTLIEALTLPDSVQSIGLDAFNGVPINSLSLGEGVETLGQRAFANTQITDLTIPGNMRTIDREAFAGAPISALKLSEGLESIGQEAFAGAPITALAVPGSVRTIGAGAFRGAPIERLELSEGIETIEQRAFVNTKLSALTVPASVRTVGDFAFAGAPLVSLTLCEGLETIGAGAFADTRLGRATVPASVRELGSLAFCGSGMKALVLLGAPKLLDDALSMSYYDAVLEVDFRGGVPEFSDTAFQNTRVAALYPGDNAAWTKDVRRSYGGDVTWLNSDAAPAAADKRAGTDKLKAEKSDPYGAAVADNGNGTYTRVYSVGKKVVVEICNTVTGKLIWKKKWNMELPLWGGFYSGTRFNFLAFGQSNSDENDACEVVRVVRYTKNWNRVDAASVKGNNTVWPFRSGTLSMVESGNMLYLSTAHLMYKSSDGYNHQANFKVDIYIPTMQVSMVRGEVSNFSTGYVSHSFDQYIIEDGDDVVELDLGDAYPRAVAMYRHRDAAGNAVKSGLSGEGLLVMDIAGDIGNNYTGVALAGLEATQDYYITAGVSVSQKGENPAGPQNVFVAAVPKGNYTQDGVTMRWLTRYKVKDDRRLSVPKLVKLSDDSLLLLWTENRKKTCYVYLDGAGQAASPVYTAENMVTDGKPMVSGGQVCWLFDGLGMASVAADNALHAPQIKSLSNKAKGIQLAWSKVGEATGYVVYRRVPGGKWKKLATVKGATSYVDKEVKSGKAYSYIVRACKGKVVSGYSDTGRFMTRMLAPKKVKVSRDWGRLTVTWGKVTGAKGYRVYRKTGSGSWKLVGEIADARRVTFTDWNVKAGKKYSYKVSAINGDYSSAYSAATKAMKP